MNRPSPYASFRDVPRVPPERSAGLLGVPSCTSGGYLYSERTFIDLFAGAGCLSLGLMASGWRGILAVEKNAMAFETLSHNLIDRAPGYTYEWPEWFPKKPCTVGRAAGTYRQQLLQLRGRVTMIVGGPPCQGFSLAGRRNRWDSRNDLFKAYMRTRANGATAPDSP